ncbi:MAG: uroporphyrinogen-III C-methyltransferase [Bacteroidota bacterium]
MKIQNKNKARVTIIGAGPGDVDLITVKGLNIIQSADVILYDALTNPDLLHNAPKAKKIFVGKRSGKHSMKQEEINLLLVQSAFRYGHVVRLKGGDPFIFGRGHEELEYVKAFNIPVDLVPGLSSATALSALQEVPVTRRGISESFWVLTGTTKAKQLSKDLHLAAQSSATLVILMAIKKLPLIQEILLKAGKKDTPILIIQNGSRSDEKRLLTTVEHVAEEAKAHQIGTPGIIIVGEVVSLHPAFINKQMIVKWNQ